MSGHVPRPDGVKEASLAPSHSKIRLTPRTEWLSPEPQDTGDHDCQWWSRHVRVPVLGAIALFPADLREDSLDARVQGTVARALAEELEADEVEFLRRAVRADPARAWLADVLLAAVDGIPREPATSSRPPLTSRERVVLRCLPTLMSNPEIADELYISINTVKSHLRSIYRKLGTATRRETVARARELRLIG